MNFKEKIIMLKVLGIIQIFAVFTVLVLFLNNSNSKINTMTAINNNEKKIFNFEVNDLDNYKLSSKQLMDIIIIENNTIDKLNTKLFKLNNGKIIDDYFKDYKYVAKDVELIKKENNTLSLAVDKNDSANVSFVIDNLNKTKSDYQIVLVSY